MYSAAKNGGMKGSITVGDVEGQRGTLADATTEVGYLSFSTGNYDTCFTIFRAN